MKKSKFLVVATLIATMLSATSVFAENQGKIINGRTMIPLRGAFTNLGFEVSWDGTTNTATLKDETHLIKVKKDDVNFTVDGVSYKSDVAPQLIGGSIYIPLRSIGEKIGAVVDYDDDYEMASMTYGEDYTYIYLGTIEPISKSSYNNEDETVDNIIDMELAIIDEFNEALDYVTVGDFESAYELFEGVISECEYLITDDFEKLSPSIQENVLYFGAYTVLSSESYILTLESVANDDMVSAEENIEYAEKMTVLINLYHEALVDFYNDTYVN